MSILTPTLIGLIIVVSLAAGLALYSIVSLIRRREVIRRATVEGDGVSLTLLKQPEEANGLLDSLVERFGAGVAEDDVLRGKLTQGGFDIPTAPAYYSLFRFASIVIFPLLAVMLVSPKDFLFFVMAIGIAGFCGMIAPVALLDRMVRLRQERLRRSVPDALDLLVVCVEAGVSLDAGILRVSKEVRLGHPDLAYELTIVSRLSNAGMPRDEALRTLWKRTGVEELRTLVASLIQSEKWGTSVATVLRESAKTLRRKRKQAAEKQAKMAPLKMTFPLLLFILPPLFVVILGPAVVQVAKEFKNL